MHTPFFKRRPAPEEPALTRLEPLMKTEKVVPAQLKEERGLNMKDQDLSSITTLSGFIGACVVDCDSGMLISRIGGETMDLELASAANAEVVRAKKKAIEALGLNDNIEDILITLGKHYHLIRPLSAAPSLFLYLALDKANANLGLARIGLKSLEGKLKFDI